MVDSIGRRSQGNVRLADLLAALSLGIDLGMGQPQAHVMRTVLLAVALARELALSDSIVSQVYYATLVRLVGCTSDAYETARMVGGDDVGFRARAAVYTMGELAELASLPPPSGGAGPPPGGLEGLAEARREALTAHCEVGGLLADQLGLPDAVCEAVRCGFAAWDGRGVPQGLTGDAIPIAARIAIVARDVEIVARSDGCEAAVALARSRRGRAYDPAVVDAFEQCCGGPWFHTSEADIWKAMLDAEPSPAHATGADQLDPLLTAFAWFADLKSPFTVGHSTGVATLSGTAASRLGLAPAEVREIACAGYLHDLGRVGVPNGIWEKPGPLTLFEWERVRLHPYLTERILERCRPLNRVARLAGGHHERLDGSGYHRGSRLGDQNLAQRILAAADAYRAMTETRPYRSALTPAAVTRQLEAEVAAGRLDREAVEAVLAAAAGTHPRRGDPHHLTPREIEVLRLVCRGRSNRETADVLHISPKTVGHHVQHIYEKLGVSTRAAATLAALRRGLLEG